MFRINPAGDRTKGQIPSAGIFEVASFWTVKIVPQSSPLHVLIGVKDEQDNTHCAWGIFPVRTPDTDLTLFERLRNPERAKNAKPEAAVLTASFGEKWDDPLKQAFSSVNLTPFNDFLVFDGVSIRIHGVAKFTSFSISFVAGIFADFTQIEQAIQTIAAQIIASTEDDKTYLHNFTDFLSSPPYNKEGLVAQIPKHT